MSVVYTTEATVIGPAIDVDRFIATHVTNQAGCEYSGPALDFRTIIPRPDFNDTAEMREWCHEAWGVRAVSFDYVLRTRKPDRLVFSILTVNGFAEPIWRKLAEMWPTLMFGIEVDDGETEQCVGRLHGSACQFDRVPYDMDRFRRLHAGS